jgi:outer membrane lipoprotein carrier protein
VDRRKRLLAATAFVFLTAVPAAKAQTSPQAAPIVRLLEARYHDAKTLQAVFLEKYSDSRQGLQVESGKVYFSRPGRMRWDYESPEPKVFLSDGKNVWFYVPADHTVTRAPVKESTDWRTPLALLTGKANLGRLCEKIDLGSEPGAAPGNVVLHCRARGQKQPQAATGASAYGESSIADPAGQFQEVWLEVNPDTGELANVRVLEPGGVELEFRFGNWKENEPLQETLFHFQAPVGVAIVNEPREPQ